MSVCKRCGAEIRWEKTTGGNMALDPEPNPKGNVMLLDGVVVVLNSATSAERAAAGETLYMTHWATCPDPPARKR